MTARNEVFDSIKISGLTFENPVSDTFDTLTAGQYPSQNSILMITDSKGTAQFSRNITVDTLTVQNVTADLGTFTDLSATSAIFTNLAATNISVGSVYSSGPIRAAQLNLNSGSLTTDASGNPVWNGQNLLGWNTLLAPTTYIPLLAPTATAFDIAQTVNTLLTALKNKGIVIS
jgi:hypothetical protein